MKAAQIRQKFLDFFRAHDHEIVHSSPVVPHNDPTLLFANAGMNQFKSVFTGEEERNYTRAATTQKCVRAGGKHNDLENVGFTARHLTFFEMLGNFSFGDYFKPEACRYAWDLVTDGLGLDPKNLWVTVFREDQEAREIWRDEIGVANDRIVDMGEKDNFWSMGDTGPCGPCSEIFVDRGEDKRCGPECGLGLCDCDRYLEFWNLVFMQYERTAEGDTVPLPKPSIDTGMGLERIALLLQGKSSVFETDLLARLVEEVAQITGRVYRPDEGTAHHVIAEHVRTHAIAIADGAYPSNEDAGYVLRRILRRASRFGDRLGMEQPFIYRLVQPLIEEMGEAFPELAQRRTIIEERIQAEEESFLKTLRRGVVRFEEEAEKLARAGAEVFSGGTAFFLHDTCGFPIDLTQQMAKERDLTVDLAEYNRLMDDQKERARQSRKTAVSDHSADLSGYDDLPATHFLGYQEYEAEGEVLVARESESEVEVVLDRTPFYGEGGGQVGDTGVLENDEVAVRVTDTLKTGAGVFVHRGRLERGSLSSLVGQRLRATIDVDRRLAIQRNHTATHLMHAALREVLGDHVQQKGSLVEPGRLRFDVSHFSKVTPEEVTQIERRVQAEVLKDTDLVTGIYPKEEALARGALAFFGDKYGDEVRVVEIPGFSVELCGGAHVRRTGEIGSFLIVSEGAVSAGVRRIEAITGEATQHRLRADEDLILSLSRGLGVTRDELEARVQSLVKENRDLKSGKSQMGAGDVEAQFDRNAEVTTIGSSEVVTCQFEGAPAEALLEVADRLKRRPGARYFVLLSVLEEGVRFVVGHSADAKKGSIHSGKIAKEGATRLGGGGGGRPEMAQAGGKDREKAGEALRLMRDEIVEALS